jgi:hypothetical protein
MRDAFLIAILLSCCDDAPTCDMPTEMGQLSCGEENSSCVIPTTMGIYNCRAVAGTCTCENHSWNCPSASSGAACSLPNGTVCFTEGTCTGLPPPDMYSCEQGHWVLHAACIPDAMPDAPIGDAGAD